ncbi:MAG: DUF177 domain-containing protein [Methylotenera sp.]
MNTPPLFIDNLAFSKKNERLAGTLSLTDCQRLNELLQSAQNNSGAADQISYILQGKTDVAGQHLLLLSISANLMTTCQRCLNEMPLNFNLKFKYLIGDVSDTDVEVLDIDNNDDYDLQQASQTMDLIALIEDEIIMAMPIAPAHNNDCGTLATQSGEKPNPFAVLKGFIKS